MLKTMLILSGILLSSSVLAKALGEEKPNSHFFLGISAGPTWTTGNRSQTFYLEPGVQKTYAADSNWTVFPSAEIFMGWQKPLNACLLRQSLTGQIGLALVSAGNAELSGEIWEDANAAFNNFDYNYKVQHTHAALKARLFAGSDQSFQPYVSASVGMGFNHAYDFTITPKISNEIAPPPFQSNTQTSLVYTLGIGLQKALNKYASIAIGYEFSDWGKVKLSPAAGQTLNQGLSLSHLYANQLQFALYYIF